MYRIGIGEKRRISMDGGGEKVGERKAEENISYSGVGVRGDSSGGVRGWIQTSRGGDGEMYGKWDTEWGELFRKMILLKGGVN